MWDSIANIVNGGNGIFILVFVLIVIIIAMLLSKSGMLNIHTSSFSLGAVTREREIIMRQIETAHTYIIEAMDMLEVDGNDYHIKYIFERIYDKVVEWVLFNHISTNQIYLDSKSMAVYNLIVSLNPPKSFDMIDAKKKIPEWVKSLIQQLMQIREYYSRQRG